MKKHKKIIKNVLTNLYKYSKIILVRKEVLKMDKYEIYNKILQILSELPLNSKKMEVFKKALSDLLDL